MKPNDNIVILPTAIEHTGASLFIPAGALSQYMDEARQFMLSDLAKSGLTPEDMDAAPVAAYSGVTLAYRIPYNKPFGGRHPVMHAVKGNSKSKSIRKYDRPKKKDIGADANLPYFPKDWLRNWSPGGVVRIDEGEKKAACAVKRGATSFAIGGAHNGNSPDALKVILTTLEQLQAKEVELGPDPDILTNMQVQSGWMKLYGELQAAGYVVKMRDHSKTGKLDDYLANHTLEEYYRDAGWLDVNSLQISPKQLIAMVPALDFVSTDERTTVKNTSDNLTKIARKIYGERLWYNSDRQEFMYGDEPWDEFTTVLHIANEFQSRLGFNRTGRGGNEVTAAKLEPVLKLVARETVRSPRNEWLDSLIWDGVPRLETWAIRYCNVVDSPFIREASKRLLVAGVARTFSPGCFLRWRPILKGPQDVGKTYVWYALFGRENVAILSDAVAEGKDLSMVMASSWIVVDDELGKSASRASQIKEKSIISQTEVTFRPPYGRKPVTIALGCLQAGSTNNAEFLQHDPSGNNRHVVFPIESRERFDFKALAQIRDQLWAEAVYLYRAGHAYDTVPGADEAAKKYELTSPLTSIVENAIRAEWKKKLAQAGGETTCAYMKIGTKHGNTYVGVQATSLKACLEAVSGVRVAKLTDVTGALEELGFVHDRNGIREKDVSLRPAHLMLLADFEKFLKSDALDALK